MTSIVELLQTAAGSGEVVTIAYNGGSRPGQARQVVPTSVSNQDLVAVEPGSRINKHYKLDRIAWVELSSGQRALNAEAEPPVVSDVPTLETLTAYAQHFSPELRAAGWHIYESETSFAVATHFKNGKPRKTPSVSIQYFDPSTETVFDLESGDVKTVTKDLTGHEKPWRIDSWRFKKGKSFGHLQRAFELFIQEARASDPATAKVLFSSR